MYKLREKLGNQMVKWIALLSLTLLGMACSPANRNDSGVQYTTHAQSQTQAETWSCVCTKLDGCFLAGMDSVRHTPFHAYNESANDLTKTDAYPASGGYQCISSGGSATPKPLVNNQPVVSNQQPVSTIASQQKKSVWPPTLENPIEIANPSIHTQSCDALWARVPSYGFLTWDEGACVMNPAPTSDSGLPWAGKNIKDYGDYLRYEVAAEFTHKTPKTLFLCYCDRPENCASNHPYQTARIMDEYGAFFFQNPLSAVNRGKLGFCQARNRR